MVATESNLRIALSIRPHILHITCHGKKDHLVFEPSYTELAEVEQYLAMKAEKFNDAKDIPLKLLGDIFAEYKQRQGDQFRLKLVNLSACESDLIGQELITRCRGLHVVCTARPVLD